MPEYRDAEESYIFVLSEAEELVPAGKLAGVAWVDDTRATDTHHVVRYRPRTEGGFSRIERWTHKQTRETHWVVTSGANSRLLVGGRHDLLVVTPQPSPPSSPPSSCAPTCGAPLRRLRSGDDGSGATC